VKFDVLVGQLHVGRPGATPGVSPGLSTVSGRSSFR
jgi:hypothetical protein